jgi:hypothetical protein
LVAMARKGRGQGKPSSAVLCAVVLCATNCARAVYL